MDHIWKQNILANKASFEVLQSIQRQLQDNGRENRGNMITVPELLISMLFMSVIYLLLTTIISLYMLKIIRNNYNLANGLGESNLPIRERVFLSTLLAITICRVVGMPLRAFSFQSASSTNLILLFGDFPIFLWECCLGMLLFFWMKKCLKIKNVPVSSDQAAQVEVFNSSSSLPLLYETGIKATAKEHRIASKFQTAIIITACVWFAFDSFSYLFAAQTKTGQTILSEQSGTFLSNVSGLASLGVLTFIVLWAVIVAYQHIPKDRRGIEKSLIEGNQVIFFFVLSVIVRFVVTVSVLIHDWISSSDYVYIIYPFYYFVVEWWPIMFLLFKLIFSKHNYCLTAKPSPVLTYPGIDVSKTNVFFGKRGHTLYALKYTTINEVKILQHLRMQHPNIINYIDHEQVEVEKLGRKSNRLRLLLEFVPPIPREASTLINYIKQGYQTISKRIIKEHDLYQLVRIAVKITKGMAFLHSQNIAHLDIKYDNVLVMDVGMHGTHTQLMVKIIDFEDAETTDNEGTCIIDQTKAESRHPHFWVDPALVKGGVINGKAADVFSFGHLMYVIFGSRELVTSKINTRVDTSVAAFEKCLRDTFEEFPRLTNSQSVDLKPVEILVSIFKECTNSSPYHRPPIGSVLDRFRNLKSQLGKRRTDPRYIQLEDEELIDQ